MSSFSVGSPSSTAAPLTIFAMPKAFRGHIGVIQRNAISSWTRIQPRPHILLLGNDEGTPQVARELGVDHVPEVQRNPWGTPLVSDIFAKAQTSGDTPNLCYVNSDIMLFDDFMAALLRVAAWSTRFLMVGRRTDTDITQPLPFQQPDWASQVRDRARRTGRLQIARNIDYFAFPRGLYSSVPPFGIGRFWWDNWLVWKVRSVGAPVVDASAAVLAIHQNHDYSHTTYGPGKDTMMASDEAVLNCRLTCENPADFEEGLQWRYVYTIDDATWKLTSHGVARNPRHLWKNFKRTTSRPLGMARLARRALFPPKSHPASISRD
jgi:hypothetical protein